VKQSEHLTSLIQCSVLINAASSPEGGVFTKSNRQCYYGSEKPYQSFKLNPKGPWGDRLTSNLRGWILRMFGILALKMTETINRFREFLPTESSVIHQSINPLIFSAVVQESP